MSQMVLWQVTGGPEGPKCLSPHHAQLTRQSRMVGGHGKGGLLVREGRILDSCEAASNLVRSQGFRALGLAVLACDVFTLMQVQQRLATGALIEDLMPGYA